MTTNTDHFDVDFGRMRHDGIDAWLCTVPIDLPHPPTRQFWVRVWSPNGFPSQRQRERLCWLKTHYAELWPEISAKIDSLSETNEGAQLRLTEGLAVNLGGPEEDSLELVYQLDESAGPGAAIFVVLNEHGIEDALIAE